VGLTRPGWVEGGAAALGGGAEAGLVEPALQGAFGGNAGAGEVLAQQDAEVAGPPGRVLPPPGQRLVVQLLRGLRAGTVLVAVGRGKYRVGVRAEAVQEWADRAQREAEGLGNGGGRLAAPVTTQERLPQRQGSGCGQRKSSRGVGEKLR
jgi:hypothetical protein